MTRTSLRSRLLTTTAVLSVVLASMTPARLPAQETAPAEVPPVAAPTRTAPPEAEAPAPEPEEAAPETPQAVTPDMEVMEPEPEDEAPARKPAPAEAETPEAPDEAPAPRTPEATERDAPATAPDEAPAPRTPKATEPEAPAEAVPEEEVAPRATEAPEGRDTNAAGSEGAPARRDAPETEADEPDATPAERNSLTPEAEEPEATESEAPPARPSADRETPAARDTEAKPTADTANGDDAEAVDTLNSLLERDDAAPVAAAAAAAAATGDEPLNNATVTEVTEENARSSDEDFRTSASGEEREANRDKDDDDDDNDGGLSNLQKVGLLALGGLAVGALMNNGDEVVSNTGDRVVLRQNDGSYQVLKDDDALLRQPGSTVRTENYADGSTRSIVEQGDGSRIETIRDASGRVLRRARINPDGTQTLLIDDTRQAAPVDLSRLPQTRDDVRVSATDRTSLRDALDRIAARDDARLYSLSQIRDYRQVRAMAPVVDVDNITFRTGSAAVEASEAEQLSDLGTLMRDMNDERPGEVFLIEGHTDAVGSAASNLALSDRRAESVALALTEYFDVPPENMVVQGYGESDLRVQAEGDEARNRRVAVRIITPILQVAQNQ
ncbi:OmpA family protein [Falsirhodobacter sp. 1013]|uniref:OmpA family protein n=1 Tax=Falsirhodobacter sp. 1013 TaxID=3417566 RepID=UPI003EB7A13B